MRYRANITKSLYQIQQRSNVHKTCCFLASSTNHCHFSSSSTHSNSWRSNGRSGTFQTNLHLPTNPQSKSTRTNDPPQIRFKSSAAAITTADDSSTSTTTIPFLLADIGEGIAEVEIIQWFTSPGDAIAQFDKVCEVQSDKATVEITSRYDGTVVSLEGKVGDMVNVGSPLIYIDVLGESEDGGSGEDYGDQQQLNGLKDEVGREGSVADNAVGGNTIVEEGTSILAHDHVNGQTEISAPTFSLFDNVEHPSQNKVLTTPAVRKLAKEHKIDLTSLKGTGPKGRILKSDILNLLNTSITTEEKDTPILQAKTHSVYKDADKEDEVVPIRGYHRLMIKTMELSLSIPHMTYSDEINMTALKQFRHALKQKQHRISYLPFMIKAASLSLNEYPILNSSLTKTAGSEGKAEELMLTYHKSHDIGVAMDSPRGLVVPVIRDCGHLSIVEISEELLRLQSLASEGSLSEQDISNPTFTLSNIGSIGGTYMSPIVVPPTVAIGAMGKIQRLPRFIDNDTDEVEAVDIMQISWGGDHRVIDGATMAKFSNLWKDYLEDPLSMLLYMK
mmetsp:Transcript_10202/g.14261  ORF Transcript_10202/g.14261 Transcript_10202/m.14261 type:complete len:560 (-) Transcript_10202:443-2122(-)|eukprot:CAMPEP_0185730214 /NCGR_PEP_ID=MMETSP1171-20130828/8895_1 /TAXON_ID=374046 /ORGANISM="Helicotheca tamensis, Strain CCMP826" /LENGTH=559 /DNA_ID=CAMNT_0028399219 /DNA_START=292 /DNA_END=1971 /DNA_ORIENTATION=-